MHKHLIFLTAVIVLLVTACNPQPLPVEPTPIPTLPPATLPAEPVAAPLSDEQAETTETTAAVDVDAGAQVFDSNCSACHDLGAEIKIGPGLTGLFDKEMLPNDQPVDDENLKQWILTGGGTMPGMALENAELETLVAFLRDATQQ